MIIVLPHLEKNLELKFIFNEIGCHEILKFFLSMLSFTGYDVLYIITSETKIGDNYSVKDSNNFLM